MGTTIAGGAFLNARGQVVDANGQVRKDALTQEALDVLGPLGILTTGQLAAEVEAGTKLPLKPAEIKELLKEE